MRMSATPPKKGRMRKKASRKKLKGQTEKFLKKKKQISCPIFPNGVRWNGNRCGRCGGS